MKKLRKKKKNVHKIRIRLFSRTYNSENIGPRSLTFSTYTIRVFILEYFINLYKVVFTNGRSYTLHFIFLCEILFYFKNGNYRFI